MFELSGRGERLSCGEKALMFGAALGLLHARAPARALQLRGQRGLTSLPALACTPEDKFSCIIDNRMAAPCSTAWHAAGGHGRATWCLTHRLPQRCCSDAFTKTCFSVPASHRTTLSIAWSSQRRGTPAWERQLGRVRVPPKCLHRRSSQA